MSNKDYYNILGVGRDATDEDIKKAYKKLVLQYHPDRQQGKTDKEKEIADAKFKEINEAYHILTDSTKRKLYDTYGTVDEQVDEGMGHMSDFMREFMRRNGFTENGFQNKSMGSNIEVHVNLTVAEILGGKKKEVTFKRARKCVHCNGTGSADGRESKCPNCGGTGFVTRFHRSGFGAVQQTMTCPSCGGSGKVVTSPCHHCGGSGLEDKEDKISFNIPIGVCDGAYTVFSGYGDESPDGGPAGDAILIFHIDMPDGFSVGKAAMQYGIPTSDIYSIVGEINVPILDCITGGDVKFVHPDGKKIKFKIGKCTEDGTSVRMAGKGLPRKNGTMGDLYMVIHAKMPKTLNFDDIKKINELKKSNSFK